MEIGSEEAWRAALPEPFIIEHVQQEPVRTENLPALPPDANVLRDARCSSARRDEITDFLSDMHAEGFITAEELEARRAYALLSPTEKMLRRVIADFPVSPDQWAAARAREDIEREERSQWVQAQRREAEKAAAEREKEKTVPPKEAFFAVSIPLLAIAIVTLVVAMTVHMRHPMVAIGFLAFAFGVSFLAGFVDHLARR
jgi:DUF1707 SHOCT-like domain